MKAKPTIIVFDVNETLLDIEVLQPLFARLFADAAVLREWFAQLIVYAEAMTLAGLYVPFNEVGAGVLRMVGTIRGVTVVDADIAEMRDRMQTMPPHPEAADALRRLRDAGFRLATLTNSPPSPGTSPLESAGLSTFFEQTISVDAVRRFKPAPETYRMTERALGAGPASLCMVAAHTWDTLGAQAAGWTAALVTRPGNAVLPVAGVPQPDIQASDLAAVADRIIAKWKP